MDHMVRQRIEKSECPASCPCACAACASLKRECALGRLTKRGITHILIVRSTLERRLDPKFPTELKYQIVEVSSRPTVANVKTACLRSEAALCSQMAEMLMHVAGA